MKNLCLLVNIFGGIGVLLSYVLGIARHSNATRVLWGGIPESMRGLYGVGMIAAALGYLLCAYYVLFVVDSEHVRIFSWGYGLFTIFYILILIPSMLWMPLTFEMAASPHNLTWIAIRVMLFLVAIGACGLIVSLLAIKPQPTSILYWLALAGSVAFFAHTFILDAIIWPHLFNL